MINFSSLQLFNFDRALASPTSPLRKSEYATPSTFLPSAQGARFANHEITNLFRVFVSGKIGFFPRFGPFRTVLGFDVVYSDAVEALVETLAELLSQDRDALALIGSPQLLPSGGFSLQSVPLILFILEMRWI